MTTPPAWLHTLSVISLGAAVACALVVLADILFRSPQRMAIMNLVWPLTALWSGPLGLYGYWRVGRLSAKAQVRRAKAHHRTPPGERKPFWQSVALAVTHCGSGCTLGDVMAESLVIVVPVSFLGYPVFGTWLVDFAFAFVLGIVFQYFTIAPMRGLGLRDGLIAALKADSASLTAWQIGMYGMMALALFVFFSPETLPKSSPVFWFMMQLAMLAGFVTSYPVNWWLLRAGIKEPM